MAILSVAAIIVGMAVGIFSAIIQMVGLLRVKNERIDIIVNDLFEALKQHQVGINIPHLSEKAGIQTRMSIRKVLARHL